MYKRQSFFTSPRRDVSVLDEAILEFAKEKERGIFLSRDGIEDGKLKSEIIKAGISSLISLPLKDGEVYGAINLYRKGTKPPFTGDDILLVEFLTDFIARRIREERLRRELAKKEREVQGLNILLQEQQSRLIELEDELSSLEKRYEDSVKALTKALDLKIDFRKGHIEEVRELSEKLAEKLGVPKEKIRKASFIYDLGLIKAPDFLLSKPGPLSEEEKKVITEHPILSAKIAEDILSPDEREIVCHHHENYDGSGYPDGLKGDEIPIGARILRVVDSFVAMKSPRPYRKALSWDEAVEELKKGKGTLYDPEVVDAFISILEERGKPKEDVTGTIAHELRHPLTFLVGYSELLASQENLPEEARERAREIYEEAQRMAKLIDNILDLSRIESGEIKLNKRKVDLSKMLEDITSRYADFSKKHDFELNIKGKIEVEIDPERITQVLDNLLRNAVDYSEGGVIEVGARENEEVIVWVKDEGPGVPPDKREKIFEKFYKGEGKGLGLGLFISRKIVEAHGGRIWVEDEGKGAKFVFSIPK